MFYLYVFQSTNWLLIISTSLLESFPLEAPWTMRSKNDTPWLQGALPAECPPCSDGNDRRPHPRWHHHRCCPSRGKRCPGQHTALGPGGRMFGSVVNKLHIAHVMLWMFYDNDNSIILSMSKRWILWKGYWRKWISFQPFQHVPAFFHGQGLRILYGLPAPPQTPPPMTSNMQNNSMWRSHQKHDKMKHGCFFGGLEPFTLEKKWVSNHPKTLTEL